MNLTITPEPVPLCAGCTGFGPECYKKERCIECRADLRDPEIRRKTGYVSGKKNDYSKQHSDPIVYRRERPCKKRAKS
jgi:hypothetical protein